MQQMMEKSGAFHGRGSTSMNIALWVVAGLVGLAFLLAGFMKAFMPVDNLKKNMAWVTTVPAPFVRFIGVAEMLGAIGLILPAVTGIASWLVVAAAGGLAFVQISAAVFHGSRKEYSNIGGNVVLLGLSLFVLVGRWAWAPF
jgi:putative oxidoreductase